MIDNNSIQFSSIIQYLLQQQIKHIDDKYIWNMMYNIQLIFLYVIDIWMYVEISLLSIAKRLRN